MKILYCLPTFPPVGGTASIRNVKHIKYLHELGAQQTVIYPEPYGTITKEEPALLDDVPDECEQIQITNHDNQILQTATFFKTVRRYLSDNQIDWMVTGPPVDLYHLLGYLLSKVFDVRWHADSQEPLFPATRTTPFKKIKQFCMSHADLITGSWPTQTMFAREIADSPQTYWIPHGWDPDEYSVSRQSSNEKTIFLHAGTLVKPAIDPSHFFEVLRNLFDKNLIDADDFEFRFCGTIHGNELKEEIEQIKQSDPLGEVLNFKGFVSRSELIRQVNQADVCFGFYTQPQISSKIFEYVGSGNHILCYHHDRSPMRKLFKGETGISWVDFGEQEQLEERILELIKQPDARTSPDDSIRNKYSFETITREILNLYEGNQFQPWLSGEESFSWTVN